MEDLLMYCLWIAIGLIVVGFCLIRYDLLPEGSENANPIRNLFGKSGWSLWESDKERLERLVEEYTLLTQVLALKSQSQGIGHVQHSQHRAEADMYAYLSAIHKAAGAAGLPIKEHAEIAVNTSRLSPELAKLSFDAELERKMYVYDKMATAREEYHRLKKKQATSADIKNQEKLLSFWEKEWESFLKN